MTPNRMRSSQPYPRPTSRRRVVTQQNNSPPVAHWSEQRREIELHRLMVLSRRREIAWRVVQPLGPARRGDHDVLEPQAEPAGQIDAGLHAERVTGHQRRGVAGDDVRVLVRLGADAVTGAVHEVVAEAGVQR